MKHKFCYLFAACVFSSTAPFSAFAASSTCSANQALALTKANPPIIQFCAAKINGTNYGCEYTARHATPLKDSPHNEKWEVLVQTIHSYNKDGTANYMPKGSIFVDVSQSCKITHRISFPLNY